ncbi:ATPase, AAA family protein [Methylocaldum marinum]|uniref:ATPase, AAA family protein n=1 Tax=Methylocaldum marinum TaxID=1432792 RepID=A0A250L084_9GAMM|nr:ATP-binding protein [Methylocaldum marinum]BBA37252.1 ATPase, AAA family protein [Methylocaldum marinum]
MEALARLIARASELLDRLERQIPSAPADPDWAGAIAFRWRGTGHAPSLQHIRNPHRLALADILCVDRQKCELDRNTRQFIRGLPANNALLWGSKGTGKSSLIKALLNEYAADGLRVIEVDRRHLVELPDILDLLYLRPEKFILFSDDLSFEADDAGYKALKSTLEGSFSAPPANVLIYATSNRRHLLPEYHEENLLARQVEGEIHQGEAVEEKISLSERFGLWLSFYPFNQDQFLDIVRYWLDRFQTPLNDWETVRAEALRFALQRGSRSGRVAWQFAKDWSGRTRLGA